MPNNKGEIWYSIHLENGWVYRRASKISLEDWKGKVRDFIVTTELNEDGSVKLDKEGKEKRSFRAPSEDDWNLIKKKTEQNIVFSGKTVMVFMVPLFKVFCVVSREPLAARSGSPGRPR